ncbi:polysaccharide pyruvyl transferase family protein [Bacteroides gallinaceum]|uniref:Polysaccharide pyruvyl transferase family protein n=1 Tax=Bacteroides gallinaceum TaxID=1462571 RepID=A0ABT7X1W2_9BACE|nr:polysaccharide pyruvyl transferase family protein [Bacteroides gallinaceum]MDN0048065.1 polysaccharide pyruvyl transferase family protein [Bacteroides gallinaceum]
MGNKKKIGCVIAYTEGHNNYGTSLQGYAMLKKIQQLGYEVEVIHYAKQLSTIQKIKFVANAIRAGEWKSIVARLTAKRTLKNYPQYAAGIAKRTKAVNAYKAKKLLPLFHTYVGYDALHKGSLNYDAVVVGSDQVWTPMSLPNKFFNLLFVDDSVHKIAYASSFGVSEIPSFQRKETGLYLDRFYRIGVREERGKEIVEELSHQKATVVADPTLLLTREEWEAEISDARPNESEPYIFCYFLGTNQEARKAANKLRKQTGYKIITIRHMDEYVPEDEQFGDEAPYNVDPNDFVKYISKAAYVCTDSFHCTVFSILFHRQFMTFYRFAEGSKTGRNSRINSLFDLFELQERLYKGDINKITNPIDYNSVDEKLSELRKESIYFLNECLAF